MVKTADEQAKIREEALKTLAEHKDEIDKFEHKIEEEDEKWVNEIALLERRVKTHFTDIPIGKKKDETISIRASLSDAEVKEIVKLDTERLKLDPKKEDELEEINKLTDIIMSYITANPLMTPEWFVANRAHYSPEDMLGVFLSFLEGMTKRAQRVSKIKNFRG